MKPSPNCFHLKNLNILGSTFLCPVWIHAVMNQITSMKPLKDGDMITYKENFEPITKTENRTLFLIVVIYKNKMRTIPWFFLYILTSQLHTIRCFTNLIYYSLINVLMLPPNFAFGIYFAGTDTISPFPGFRAS